MSPCSSAIKTARFADVCGVWRSFAVDDILRTLDAMSMVKVRRSRLLHTLSKSTAQLHVFRQLNTFHWHVTDSQSFPLVVPGFEEISQKGAYSSSSVYTTDDVANIVSYAGAVGFAALLESLPSTDFTDRCGVALRLVAWYRCLGGMSEFLSIKLY